jgi:hypothetical protein
MTQELSADVQTRLDAHLDAVEKVLVDGGRTRAQRRAVLDDLESQIQEMLAARSANPALPDIDAVLGQIDPPGAYAEGRSNAAGAGEASTILGSLAPTGIARLSRAALWGFVCVLGALVGALVVNGIAWTMLVPSAPPHVYVEDSFVLWVVISRLATVTLLGVGLIGTILGWIGFVQIRGSKGTLRGTGLALFAGLFYPAVLVIVLVVALIALIVSA